MFRLSEKSWSGVAAFLSLTLCLAATMPLAFAMRGIPMVGNSSNKQLGSMSKFIKNPRAFSCSPLERGLELIGENNLDGARFGKIQVACNNSFVSTGANFAASKAHELGQSRKTRERQLEIVIEKRRRARTLLVATSRAFTEFAQQGFRSRTLFNSVDKKLSDSFEATAQLVLELEKHKALVVKLQEEISKKMWRLLQENKNKVTMSILDKLRRHQKVREKQLELGVSVRRDFLESLSTIRMALPLFLERNESQAFDMINLKLIEKVLRRLVESIAAIEERSYGFNSRHEEGISLQSEQ